MPRRLLVVSVGLLAAGLALADPPDRLTLPGWGTAVDPDGDARFTVEKGRLTIGLPGTDHALAVERGRMNAPRVLREVDGDFIAEVKVTGPFPAGASSLVPARRPFHGAGLLLWADDKNYVRLERAELVFDGRNMSYVNFEERRHGEFARSGTAEEMPLAAGAGAYLRLERRGNKVVASAGPDGVRWTPLPPLAVDLPKTVSVGVAAGHNTAAPFAPVFEEYRLFRDRADR